MNDNFDASIRELAAEAQTGALPDPALIWWKAEMRRRLELQRKATRPIRIAEAAAAVVVLAAVIWFLAEAWPLVSPAARELGLSFLWYWFGLATAATLAAVVSLFTGAPRVGPSSAR